MKDEFKRRRVEPLKEPDNFEGLAEATEPAEEELDSVIFRNRF